MLTFEWRNDVPGPGTIGGDCEELLEENLSISGVLRFEGRTDVDNR